MEYIIKMVKPNNEKIDVEFADGKREAKSALRRLDREYKLYDDHGFIKIQAINDRGNVCFSRRLGW